MDDSQSKKKGLLSGLKNILGRKKEDIPTPDFNSGDDLKLPPLPDDMPSHEENTGPVELPELPDEEPGGIPPLDLGHNETSPEQKIDLPPLDLGHNETSLEQKIDLVPLSDNTEQKEAAPVEDQQPEPKPQPMPEAKPKENPAPEEKPPMSLDLPDIPEQKKEIPEIPEPKKEVPEPKPELPEPKKQMPEIKPHEEMHKLPDLPPKDEIDSDLKVTMPEAEEPREVPSRIKEVLDKLSLNEEIITKGRAELDRQIADVDNKIKKIDAELAQIMNI